MVVVGLFSRLSTAVLPQLQAGSRCALLRWAAGEVDLDVDWLAVADDGQSDGLAGFATFDGFAEVADGIHLFAVHFDRETKRGRSLFVKVQSRSAVVKVPE